MAIQVKQYAGEQICPAEFGNIIRLNYCVDECIIKKCPSEVDKEWRRWVYNGRMRKRG